ncbi:MAG: hypothetical protein ACYSUD_15350 [Planctomycetota bacterium]
MNRHIIGDVKLRMLLPYWLVLFLIALPCIGAQQAGWKAGVASAAITPDESMWMAGGRAGHAVCHRHGRSDWYTPVDARLAGEASQQALQTAAGGAAVKRLPHALRPSRSWSRSNRATDTWTISRRKYCN